MDMMAKMAALTAQLQTVVAEENTAPKELPTGWVHLGERNGKPWYRTAPAVAVPKPKVNPVEVILAKWKRFEANAKTFEVGNVCPACNGTGYIRQFAHMGNGVCFKCNDPTTKGGGKGRINAQDKAYNDARIKAGTLCDVVTA